VQAARGRVLAATRDCCAVGVDIPLGCPPGSARRACDTLAASALGRARSSVFPAPPREVLAAPDYAQACAVARGLTGRAISLQTFHITPKIAEWDAVALPDRVVEVHPELALRALAPETDFAPKKSARGAGQRIAALARWVDPAVALGDLPAGCPPRRRARRAGRRLVGAAVGAWAAEVLGDERDARGRPMRIVC
jgi:predicted RNase H-like nuclease